VSLQPSDLAGQASVIAAITTGYAQLLAVPAALVSVANFTDLATGAVVAATPVANARLLGAGAPGSRGVSVSVVVALGKTPTEQQTLNMQSALAAPMPTLLASISQSVASALRVPASAFSTSAPAAVTFVGSPFVAASTVVVAAEANSAPATGGAAAGGIVGAILLACGLWAYRSYAKHGKLPCCRDRAREALVKKSSASETVEITSAIAEAEKALGGVSVDEQAAAAARFGGGGGGAAAASKKALVVKRLVEKAARDSEKARLTEEAAKAAAAEIAALRAQLAAAKASDDASEVAQLRAQLREAKTQRAAEVEARSSFVPQGVAPGGGY